MADIITSGQVSRVVGPYLNKVFTDTYKKAKPQWKMVFDEISNPNDRSYHEDVILAGLGTAQRLQEGQPTPLISSGQMYSAIYNYEQYALGFGITNIAYQDGRHAALGEAYSKFLGTSFLEAKELNAANVLNFGFNAALQVGGDRVALFSDSHPLKFGGVDSNLLPAAALSQTSLENANIIVRNALAFDGTKAINLSIMKLIVPPALEQQAKILMHTTLRTGTTANDINPVGNAYSSLQDIVCLTRLTSTTAWFLKTDCDRGLLIAQRTEMEKRTEPDFLTATLQFAATERYKLYFTDWHGAYGNAGV